MKTFIVTGAGSGIGRAIAVELGRSDPSLRLVLTGRNRKALEETRALLARDLNHLILPIDQSNHQEIKNAFRELDSVELHGLIANAGMGGENEYGEQDRWNEIIATNLSGSYWLAQESIQRMKKTKGWKHILFISSILGHLGVPHYSAYCASKAGLLGLSRSLASELAAENILVNSICPGWVETEMSIQGIAQMSNRFGIPEDQIYAEQMAPVPLKKMAKPEEIGRLVSFLVSEKQTSITGQTFEINNGALMR